MKNKKKPAKIVISLVLVVAVIAAACVYIFQKTENEKYKAVIMDVSTDTITQTLSTTGTVESLNRGEFLIYNGVVPEEVHVKLGDKVEKGQLLATFDSASLNSIVSKVQSEYDTAKINYQNSVSSANEASAKIPALDVQIKELEAQITELTAAVEAAEQSAQENTEEKVPAWIDSIDYATLSKMLGYSQEEIRDFFVRLSRGNDRTTISDIVESLKSATSFDFTSVMGTTAEETQLMSAKLNLMSLKAQRTMLETQSKNVLESTYKSLMDTAKTNLDATKASVEKLAKGWYAENDGVVSELNIAAGQPFVPATSSSGMDMNTVLGLLSGGGSADLSGIISSFVGSGESASIGMAVEYYDNFVASFALGKADILDVQMGKEAIITSLGREFTGEVIYISPVASDSSALDISSMLGSMGGTSGGSNSIPAKVLIKEPDESIIIGIDVNIDIVVDTVEDAVVVPIEAVETSASGSFVYKYDEETETVSRVEVEIGLASDTQYQIISGCEVGEKIVQNQSTALQEIAQEGKKVAATPYEAQAAV